MKRRDAQLGRLTEIYETCLYGYLQVSSVETRFIASHLFIFNDLFYKLRVMHDNN